MTRLLRVAACTAALGIAAVPVAAQTRFGPQLSWGDDDANLGLGARGVFSLRSLVNERGLDLVASFDYFFPDEGAGADVEYWELNGNVTYLIPNVKGSLAPYVGSGLNIAHGSVDASGVGSQSDTEAGLNLLGGTRFRTKGRLTPFAELRFELGGGERVVLTGGILF
jgi:hypothetical protein